MKYIKILLLLFFCLVSMPSYADKNTDTMTAADVKMEMLFVINRIELMSAFRNSQIKDLSNYIECSIDKGLWDAHSPLRDKNSHKKYTRNEIKQIKELHRHLLETVGKYRRNNPGAKCRH